MMFALCSTASRASRLSSVRFSSRSTSSSIEALQQSFRDPSSPYYLAPGQNGPAEPDGWPENSHHSSGEVTPSAAAEEAAAYMTKNGYDPLTLWEQRVCWGDLDSFRHVNNVRYVRWFESARMNLVESLAGEMEDEAMKKDVITGKGVSIILKSINVKYKRPVTYPDTLLIGQKPHSFTPTEFILSCVAYSFAQRAPVCFADAVTVWYNYDTLKKTEVDYTRGIGAAIRKREAI